MTERDVIDGGNMDRAKAREWVAELLRQFTVPKDSVVVMANLDHLAETLVREWYLDEWFETWEEPPAYLS